MNIKTAKTLLKYDVILLCYHPRIAIRQVQKPPIYSSRLYNYRIRFCQSYRLICEFDVDLEVIKHCKRSPVVSCDAKYPTGILLKFILQLNRPISKF